MFQQCLIVGNVGRNPEMRYTPDGIPVTDFTVAVNSYGDKPPVWFRVTAWRKLAEVCNNYLTKGRQVMVIGEVSVSAFTGQDGQARASLELTAREVKFLGGSAESAPEAHQETLQTEDMPF